MLRKEKERVCLQKRARDGYIVRGVSTMKIRRWTISSANCYYRKMRCNGCVHHEYCERWGYAMKGVVLYALAHLGVDRIETDIAECDKIYLTKEI